MKTKEFIVTYKVVVKTNDDTVDIVTGWASDNTPCDNMYIKEVTIEESKNG